MRPEYHEGTLQLRDVTPRMIEYVQYQIDKNEIHVAKCSKAKGGMDWQLGSTKFMQQIGKKLKNKFCGELKISSKLFTRNRQTSKEVYRTTVLFRHYPFKRGQMVMFKGEEHKIILIESKLRLQNKETGKRVTASFDQVTA